MRQLLFLFILALSCGAWAQDHQSPEQVVRSFAEAINRKDLARAAKLVKDGAVGQFVGDTLGVPNLLTMTLSNVVSAMVGERALVTFDVKVDGGVAPSPLHSEFLVLVKSGDDWLIDVPMREGGLAFMTFMLSNPPMLAQARTAAKSTMCISNAKQLALATIMFITDADDVFKFTPATWGQKIAPYLKNNALFTCPEDPKGTISYSFNAKLAGKSENSIDSPATTVMIYEGKDGQLNFKHSGRAAVAFADGHAKLVTKEEAKSLVWKASQ